VNRAAISENKKEINQMNYKLFKNCLLTIVILLCAMINAQAKEMGAPKTSLPGENVILRWNRVLTETIRTPGAHPGATIFPVRSYAMMHAAMFDAVNSIDGSYTPYLTDVPGTKNASIEAAAAQAARDVLAALYPTRTAIFDAELAASFEGIEENRLEQGIRVGGVVAERMLAARSNDGWNAAPPPYSLPPTPGNWQPTPPANLPARFTHVPMVLPFAVTSTTYFGPPPPPALTSARYAADLNEVKELGSVNSTTRTAEQTLIAQLWHAVITPTTIFFTWNNVARDLAVSRNNTTVENARLFALFNIAVHDALITSITAKFQYDLWRPVTAIRRADEDGNPNTSPDANWSSLLIAPPYPAYTGDQAVVSMTHATIFTFFFGRDDIPFQHTWEGTQGAPGWTRSYPSFSTMAQEVAESRIYGGIHYRFDQTAGQSIGRNVGNYVFLNFLRPRRCDN
jgi:hypothetical protein